MSASATSASGTGAGDTHRLFHLLAAFEDAWQAGRPPDLAAFLPADGPPRHAALTHLVHIDLAYRLKAGEPARVEDYLHRYPELGRDAAALLGLVVLEYRLRRHGGDGPTAEDYLARFPQFRYELEDRLQGAQATGDGAPAA